MKLSVAIPLFIRCVKGRATCLLLSVHKSVMLGCIHAGMYQCCLACLEAEEKCVIHEVHLANKHYLAVSQARRCMLPLSL